MIEHLDLNAPDLNLNALELSCPKLSCPNSFPTLNNDEAEKEALKNKINYVQKKSMDAIGKANQMLQEKEEMGIKNTEIANSLERMNLQLKEVQVQENQTNENILSIQDNHRLVSFIRPNFTLMWQQMSLKGRRMFEDLNHIQNQLNGVKQSTLEIQETAHTIHQDALEIQSHLKEAAEKEKIIQNQSIVIREIQKVIHGQVANIRITKNEMLKKLNGMNFWQKSSSNKCKGVSYPFNPKVEWIKEAIEKSQSCWSKILKKIIEVSYEIINCLGDLLFKAKGFVVHQIPWRGFNR